MDQEIISIENLSLTEERKEKHELAEKVTKRIIHIASNRAKKAVNGRGWLCGTYLNSVSRVLRLRVYRDFSCDQLGFIINHLADDAHDEVAFDLRDPEEQELCDAMNRKLNELMPRLHINRYYSDIFGD